MQTGDQSRRNGRAPILTKRFSPLPIKTIPIDQLRQLDQLVTRINEIFQAVTKQIVGEYFRWRLAFYIVLRICQLRNDILPFSGNSFSTKYPFS
jgi:hypothetical protein